MMTNTQKIIFLMLVFYSVGVSMALGLCVRHMRAVEVSLENALIAPRDIPNIPMATLRSFIFGEYVCIRK